MFKFIRNYFAKKDTKHIAALELLNDRYKRQIDFLAGKFAEKYSKLSKNDWKRWSEEMVKREEKRKSELDNAICNKWADMLYAEIGRPSVSAEMVNAGFITVRNDFTFDPDLGYQRK